MRHTAACRPPCGRHHSAQNEAAVGAVRAHLEGRPDPACCLLDSWYTYRGARLVPGFAGVLSTTAPLPRPQRLVPADRAHPLGGMDLPPVCVRTGPVSYTHLRAHETVLD